MQRYPTFPYTNIPFIYQLSKTFQSKLILHKMLKSLISEHLYQRVLRIIFLINKRILRPQIPMLRYLRRHAMQVI